MEETGVAEPNIQGGKRCKPGVYVNPERGQDSVEKDLREKTVLELLLWGSG